MKIVWSDDAMADYHQNIDYLIAKWSQKAAAPFIGGDVQKVIDLIIEFPDMFPDTGYHQTRKAVIRKQVTLFYRTDKTSIQLIRFWNNYQNPKELKL